MIGCILVLRNPHQGGKKKVNHSSPNFLSSKMQPYIFYLLSRGLGASTQHKPADSGSLFWLRGKREWCGMRTRSVLLWSALALRYNCWRLFRPISKAQGSQRWSISFNRIWASYFPWVQLVEVFPIPVEKCSIKTSAYFFWHSADLQEHAVTRAMLEKPKGVSPWYFAGTHMLALPTLQVSWMIASCNQKFANNSVDLPPEASAYTEHWNLPSWLHSQLHCKKLLS